MHLVKTTFDSRQRHVVERIRFSEPRFMVPGIAARRSQIDADASVAETNDPTKVIARIMLSKFKSQSVKGGDFGVDLRLQEAFITAATTLGKFIKTKTSKKLTGFVRRIDF